MPRSEGRRGQSKGAVSSSPQLHRLPYGAACAETGAVGRAGRDPPCADGISAGLAWPKPVEQDGAKQAVWRTDPAQSGVGGSTGDIGTHAYNLGSFISGLELDELAADVHTFVAGRRLMTMRMCAALQRRCKGLLWCSQVATGNENNGLEGAHLRHQSRYRNGRRLIRTICGSRGSVSRSNSLPARCGQALRQPAAPAFQAVIREGYLEAFATIYSEAAAAIIAARSVAAVDPAVVLSHRR